MMKCPFCNEENSHTPGKCVACGKVLPTSDATFLGEDVPKKLSPTARRKESEGTYLDAMTPATPGDWPLPYPARRCPWHHQASFRQARRSAIGMKFWRCSGKVAWARFTKRGIGNWIAWLP